MKRCPSHRHLWSIEACESADYVWNGPYVAADQFTKPYFASADTGHHAYLAACAHADPRINRASSAKTSGTILVFIAAALRRS